MPTIMTPQVMQRCIVTAPARLHMGFLDLHGGLGRSFGSIGVAIGGLSTTVVAEPAESISAVGPDAERAARIARQFFAQREGIGGVKLTVTEAIPAHAGLGSGTQLALAVGTALSRLFRWDLKTRTIAQLAGRGNRSGIGIGAFDTGGFLLDGGRGDRAEPPQILARMPFPAAWRIVLVFDHIGHGIHGKNEVEAFRALPEFPAATAAELCRLTLMQALPALQDEDIAGFGRAIGAVQRIVGDYFAPAQGARFTSPAVTEVLRWMEAEGVDGVGQSSWGPTGFGVVASDTQAQDLVRRMEARSVAAKGLAFSVVSGRNNGGDVQSQVPSNVQRFSTIK